MKAVNLLPNDQRGAAKPKQAAAPKPEPTGSAFGAFLVLGLMAFAVIASAAFVLTGNSVKEREAELARVKDDNAVVQAQVAALKPYADFETVATQRVTTVKQLAESRFDWEQALRDLSRALPGDVRLRRLQGSVTGGAGGGSNIRGSVQAPAIELAGCTKSQASVARLMSRLRAVRGVTRVSLSRSEKPVPTPKSAQATLDNGQELLCGKGRPPAFEVVVFFERSTAVPAELAPGAKPAVAPGATPAPGEAGAAATPAPGATAGQSTPTTTGVSAP